MPSISKIIASGIVAQTAAASALAGFNSGSTLSDGTVKQLADFEAEFTAAQKLSGAPVSFNSVRLYTMVQGGTQNTPTTAFQAAMNTNTKMLLGIWASGTTSIQNDLDALSSAITLYGSKFTDLVVGISVGSEDLYRNSATGVANKAGVGADPSVVANFISQTRAAVKGTGLENTLVGHVDTWDVWGNSSNNAVLNAVDFLGIDAYPFFESNRGDNSIDQAVPLWNQAYSAAMAAANGKPVWITETGWPSDGPNWGQAVPSIENAQTYWDEVGCQLFGKTNTFWYTLRDSNPADEAQFAITDNLSTTPKFNLTCPVVKAVASGTASASNAAATGSTGTSGTSSGGASGQGSSSSGSTNGTATTSSSSTSSSASTKNAAAGMSVSQTFGGGMLLAALAALAF